MIWAQDLFFGVAKIVSEVCNASGTDTLQSLQPETASRLAGKLGFLSTSLWSKIGQALSRPLHG